MQAKKLAQEIKTICEEKKGIDPLVLDVRKHSDITDFFVIVSGNSARQAASLADYIEDGLLKKGVRAYHVEGKHDPSWMVLDYSDVIVHIFHHEKRQYYNLERLWGDAPQIV